MSSGTKILTASAITHGLLLLLVFVGSAFVPHKPKIEGPEFELVSIPDILVDEPNIVGGGNPNAVAPPAGNPIAPQNPDPPKPKLDPVKVETPPIKTPEPIKEQLKPKDPPPEPIRKVEPKQPKIDPDAFNLDKVIRKEKEKPAPSKPETTFDLRAAQKRKITPSANTSKNGSSNDSAAREKEIAMAAARGSAVSGALDRLRGNLSSVGGEFGIPGPGGAAYASYHLAIRKIYEDAWIAPTASRGDEPQVEVEVVIRRDGTVLDRRVLKKSGRSELDRTVQNALNRVKKVPAFPSGSTDETRTFKFNFDLANNKLSLG